MIYEFCAENVTLLEKAMEAGARRIELCDNLEWEEQHQAME